MFDLTAHLPICHKEARCLSRRWPAYRARAVFGLLLLGALWFFERTNRGWLSGLPIPNRQLAEFAAAAFEWLAFGQAIGLVLFVPAVVAGAVAEARTRQTLPDLLASRSSGAALVVDLFFAKLLHAAVLIAIGVPIVCLLGLLGGVDPRLVLYAYAGTLSTMFFVGTVSLLVSVHARRPGPALLLVYPIEAVWLVVHWFISFVPTRSVGLRLLVALNQWIAPTTPLSLVTFATISAWSRDGPVRLALPLPMRGMWSGGPDPLAAPVARMVTLQLAYGALLLAVAAWRVRPVARRLCDAQRRRSPFPVIGRRSGSLPPCSDDPMLWKESFASGERPARVGLWTLMLQLAVIALFKSQSFQYYFPRALDEFFREGYSSALKPSIGDRRFILLHILADYSAWFYAAAMIGVAVEAAMAVTREREAGTWDGLLATLLEPAEIVRAKIRGALFRQRALVAFVGAPWILAVALWALHPLGLVQMAIALGVFLWFAASLGVFCSVRATTSATSLARTLGVLFALNVATFAVGKAALGSAEGGAIFGNTFVLLYSLAISPWDLTVLFDRPGGPHLLFEAILLAYVLAYAVAAWLLCRSATRMIGAAAGPAGVAVRAHRV